jgi:hypothetical protein
LDAAEKAEIALTVVAFSLKCLDVFLSYDFSLFLVNKSLAISKNLDSETAI